MAASSVQAAKDATRQRAADLKQRLAALRQQKNTGKMDSLRKAAPVGDEEGTFGAWDFNVHRTLEGHFGKVYTMHWSGYDDKILASASQDGKMIVWDSVASHKLHNITLNSAWTMSCGFNPATGQQIACGGLDNICSIFSLDDDHHDGPSVRLAGHDGYISCCRFADETTLVTSSGDSSCIVWDVPRATQKLTLADHGGDVMCVSLSPADPALFVSSSVDNTCKVWDMRAACCTHTFRGHTSDINSVQFLPNGSSFVTGSDDSSCRLFDLRAYAELSRFRHQNIVCGITSVATSSSGRVLFAGYDDGKCFAWDLLGSGDRYLRDLNGHDERVSCVGVNRSGLALCTASWDTSLKIWA